MRKSKSLENVAAGEKQDGLSIWACRAIFGTAVLVFLWMSFRYNLNGDEHEHLSASCMIYHGMVPYRDFFEHHHPLMWYVFAPFFHFWGQTAAIYYAMRILILGAAAGTGYYIYRISRILGAPPRGGLIALAVWLSLPYMQTYGVEFRPDNFMMMFGMAGTAYFFAYLQEKRAGLLALSGGAFFVSFLFLQKIIFLLVPLGTICLGLLLRRKMRWRDAAWAAAVPLLCSAGVLWWLYTAGFWQDYWELNWLLNLKIDGRSLVKNVDFAVFWLGGAAAVWLILTETRTDKKILGVLYLLLTGQMLVHRPWFGQYLLLYYPFLALVMVLALPWFWRWKYHAAVLLLALASLVWYDAAVVDKTRRSRLRIDVVARYTDYILAHSSADDLILGDLSQYTGWFGRPASGYYWFSFSHMAAMHHYYFGKREMPDLGTVIKEKRPKIIALSGWQNCPLATDVSSNLNCKYWQNVDFDDLRAHYDNKGFVYVRKD